MAPRLRAYWSALVAVASLLLLVLWLAMHPAPAFAHAFPSRSTPDPGAVLATPPTGVDIWFTEHLTPGVSTIEVYDSARRRVDEGDTIVDSADTLHMDVDLQSLSPGVYTVVWSNVSADDGYPNRGGYAFTVLAPNATAVPAGAAVQPITPGAPTPTPPTAPTPLPLPSQAAQDEADLVDPASDRPTAAFDLVSGWLTFTALILIGGGGAFVLCCLGPALRRADVAAALDRQLARRFSWYALVLALLGGLAAFASLIAKAEIATGLPPGDLFSPVVLGALLSPWSGRVWIGRELALAAIAFLAALRLLWGRWRTGQAVSFGLITGLGGAGLVCQALVSHLAAGHVARQGPLGTVALALHLLAVGLWVGGLAYAALLLWPWWRRASPSAQLAVASDAIARFSTLALPAVLALVVSGTYAAFLLLPGPADLLTSAYGQALDVKLALLLVLVLFGAANRRTLAKLALARRPVPSNNGAPVDRLTIARGEAVEAGKEARVAVGRGPARRGAGDRPSEDGAVGPPGPVEPVSPTGRFLDLSREAGRQLLRAMRREFALALVVLLAAGTMLEVGPPGVSLAASAVQLGTTVPLAALSPTATPVVPTPAAAPTPAPPRFVGHSHSGDLQIDFTADPALSGATTDLTVVLSGQDGKPVEHAEVKLWLTAKAIDLGTQTLTLTATAPGRYALQTPAFAVGGDWDVQLVVRRDTVPEVDATFTVPVQSPAAPATPTPVPTPAPRPTEVPPLLHAALSFVPDPPAVGTAHATMRLLDGGGKPITDAQAQALWLMPQHAHLAQSAFSAAGDGSYTSDVDFSMAGAWLADVTVALADGRNAQLQFSFNVRDRGLLGNGGPSSPALAAAPPSQPPTGPDLAAVAVATSAPTVAPSVPPSATAPATMRFPVASPSPAPTRGLVSTQPGALVLSQRHTAGDLDVAIQVQPTIFRPAIVEVRLTGRDGKPAADVTRVDVQFAMQGMSHGAHGATATPLGAGVYRTEGMFLVMEGPWWLAVRIERTGGQHSSALFSLQVPPDQPSGAVDAFADRPNGPTQVVDVAVYPATIDPAAVPVTAQRPVRLQFLFVDHPPCGPRVHLDELGLQAPVDASGVADLTVVPPRSGTLQLSCAPDGLSLQLGR